MNFALSELHSESKLLRIFNPSFGGIQIPDQTASRLQIPTSINYES